MQPRYIHSGSTPRLASPRFLAQPDMRVSFMPLPSLCCVRNLTRGHSALCPCCAHRVQKVGDFGLVDPPMAKVLTVFLCTGLPTFLQILS